MNTATQQLIPVFVGELSGAPVQLVDARILHNFLEVATEFKNWIVRRIEEYGFRDGLDFRSFLTESTGGRPSKEYHLSINMAKELGMIERSEKGRQIRQYFLQMEQIAQTAFADPSVLAAHIQVQQQLLNRSDEVISIYQELSEMRKAQLNQLKKQFNAVGHPHRPAEIAAVVRCRAEGHTYADIAELLGRSHDAVKHMVRKAKGGAL